MVLGLLELQHLGDQAYNSIRDAITTGKLEPGSRLSQDSLASQLGVSRAPVRDALNRLETEGFVRTVSRKGVVVAGLTTEELLQIFEVRALIDSYTAGRACQRLTEDELARLALAVRRMDELSGAEDLNGVVQAHGDFHQVIYSACGNTELRRLAENLWARSYRYRLTGLTQKDVARASFKDHAAILEALMKRDVQSAQEAMAKDVQHTVERLLDQIGRSQVRSAIEPPSASVVLSALRQAQLMQPDLAASQMIARGEANASD